MALSFVKACKDYFETEPNGRRVTFEEFKALSVEDREQLRDALIEAGYDVNPLGEALSA